MRVFALIFLRFALIVHQHMKCIHHTVCRCACIFHDRISRTEHATEVCTRSQCESFRWIVLFINHGMFQRKGHSLGLIGVLVSYRVLTADWFQTRRLPAEALWISVNKRTYELHRAFEPFKGIIFWSHSHLRTYRFSVHYISLRKLPSRLWKMVLPVVPEWQHLNEWSTLCRTRG